jgi:hypothetical protein
MSQSDHAIDHELQKAIAVVRVVSTDLLRDDAGEPRLQQPIADAVDFPTLCDRVIEKPEQHVDAVEDNVRRVHRGGFGMKQVEHADQVEFPGLHCVG